MNNLEQRITALEESLTKLILSIDGIKSSMSTGFNKVDQNFEKVNSELGKVNERLDLLKGETSNSFESVKVKLDTLKDEISKINEVTKYDGIYSNLKIVEGGTNKWYKYADSLQITFLT